MITKTPREKNIFQSTRISRRATIVLNASIDVVFPLFGPILEKEWCDGWEPEILYSSTNLVDEQMIFRTKAKFDSEQFYTWILTQYNPANHLVEYTVSTENRIWFIRVECKPLEAQTQATVSYTFTSLNTNGEEYNRIALQKIYRRNLEDWSEAINYYLQTGSKLTQ
jgi:hypothetical protein